jgi:hypothetical protein
MLNNINKKINQSISRISHFRYCSGREHNVT